MGGQREISILTFLFYTFRGSSNHINLNFLNHKIEYDVFLTSECLCNLKKNLLAHMCSSSSSSFQLPWLGPERVEISESGSG